MVSSNRRGHLDIVAAILQKAAPGMTKTHIMYKVRLSYYQTNKYLDSLVRKGLVKNMDIKRNRKTTKIYRTTEKGMNLLHRLESLNKLLE